MNQPTSTSAVVIDANVLIGLFTKESKEPVARAAITDYITKNWKIYAPNVIVAEFLYIACKKVDAGQMTEVQYQTAIEDFSDFMAVIQISPAGDAPFIKRASSMRTGYGCSRSSDAIYLAFAEELARHSNVEILTFDIGMVNQAAKHAATVKINLLLV